MKKTQKSWAAKFLVAALFTVGCCNAQAGMGSAIGGALGSLTGGAIGSAPGGNDISGGSIKNGARVSGCILTAVGVGAKVQVADLVISQSKLENVDIDHSPAVENVIITAVGAETFISVANTRL